MWYVRYINRHSFIHSFIRKIAQQTEEKKKIIQELKNESKQKIEETQQIDQKYQQ